MKTAEIKLTVELDEKLINEYKFAGFSDEMINAEIKRSVGVLRKGFVKDEVSIDIIETSKCAG